MTRRTIGIPGTWERRWCNSGDTSLYYSKGDAVWLNVEILDEFVWKRENDIRFYAQGNPHARSHLAAADASNDRSSLFDFYKKMVTGYFSNGQPLFYLGDLSKKVQIRISTKDMNSDPPSDEYTKGYAENYSWVDFFDIMDSDEILKTVENLLVDMESERLREHLLKYHLDGRVDMVQDILRKDLANVIYAQKYHGHSWYEDKLSRGFDCVRNFVRKKYTGRSNKWFRLWKSGYLEHGGTVYVADVNETGDFYNRNGNYLTINLGWTYGDTNMRAVTYDYTPRSVQSFYQQSTIVDLGQSINSPTISEFPFERTNTDQASRYRIQATPIRSGYSDGLISENRFPYM